jgi:CDP-glucose 4,6-dehydratase
MFNQLTETYNNKRVFLTGHTGFKGSWLLCMLNMLGAQVKGYALAPTDELNLFNQLKGESLCESVIADIRDKNHLKEEIAAFKPDFIFHLAAQPLVRRSYEIPAETFEVNAIGTANLLDAVLELENNCSTVIITTDKVYENKEWIYPYRENDVLGGHDPYSASKACAEIIVNSYRQSFFTAGDQNLVKGLASARAGNVIGGGDWATDRIIPDVVKALENDEDIVVRNPNSVRPWQHVVEPLTGYLLLGAKLAAQPAPFSEAFNFGPSIADTLKVEDLVKLAIEAWGSGSYRILNEGKQVHEAGLLKLDINKAADKLAWVPHLASAEALNWTIGWYHNYKNQPAIDLSFTQIKNYWDLWQ